MKSSTTNQNQTKEEIYVEEEEVQKLIQGLPIVTLRSNSDVQMIKYQGYWYFHSLNFLRNILTFQKHFVAQDTDIIITSLPKTGSTWLKSLLFATVNRKNYPCIDQSPLLNHHPQELVYSLETDVYNKAFAYPQPHHLIELKSPRLFSTHIPYSSLPESIRTSECRIIYICRNPLDTIVSFYHFFTDAKKAMVGKEYKPPCIEDFFEDFCEGTLIGPFFEHVLEFWKASFERSDKVLFLQYEELKDDPIFHLKRLAQFIGMPYFSHPKEESEGVIKQIVDFCSIKNMKELDVNKSGVINKFFEKKSYFRKGEVGDWTNLLTPNMVERMNKLMEEKLDGSGLSFKLLPN